jgi:hypothetical protein
LRFAAVSGSSSSWRRSCGEELPSSSVAASASEESEGEPEGEPEEESEEESEQESEESEEESEESEEENREQQPWVAKLPVPPTRLMSFLSDDAPSPSQAN